MLVQLLPRWIIWRIPFNQNRIMGMNILPAVRLIYVGELYAFQKGSHWDYRFMVNPARIVFDNVPYLRMSDTSDT